MLSLVQLLPSTAAFSVRSHRIPRSRQTRVLSAAASDQPANGFDFDDSPPLVAVFSDVDGTLVHYPRDNHDDQSPDMGTNDRTLQLPPSATGMQGVISSQTLVKSQEVRRTGTKFVLVSGMRTSTMLNRLPYLPRADAYATEGGGRIFYPKPVQKEGDTNAVVIRPEPYDGASNDDLKPFTLVEDVDCRQEWEKTTAAGPDGFVGNELADLAASKSTTMMIPVAERTGALWEFGRELIAHGFVLDTKGYATQFRVNRKQQKDDGIKANFFERLSEMDVPPELATSSNLGCVDFYPADSGKKNCCQYLAQKFSNSRPNALSKHSVCLCDDDNDSDMALACDHAFIPGVGSTSMKRLIQQRPTQFSRTGEDHQTIAEGLVATERALELILERATTCEFRHDVPSVDVCMLNLDVAHQALKEY